MIEPMSIEEVPMTEQERVLVDMAVGAPAEVVWTALRDGDRIRQWFGWDAPGLDTEIEQIFHGTVTVDDDARALAWADGDRVVVEGTGDDTSHLRITRTGHTGAFDGVYDPVDEGWITFSQQLRFLVERHPDQHRRTVTAEDVDLGADDDPLLGRLGLRQLGDHEVGSRYSVPGPDGDELTGEVFFQTDLQLGLTVEREGDALLVVSRTPPSTVPPHGSARFVLSLFDTDDDRAAQVEQRWRRWWGES
jgi:hypothetical protein